LLDCHSIAVSVVSIAVFVLPNQVERLRFCFCFLADAPSIRLIGSPEIDLEEDKDALVLRCVADANPPASIVWRRAGRSEIASLQVSLAAATQLVYVVPKLLLLQLQTPSLGIYLECSRNVVIVLNCLVIQLLLLLALSPTGNSAIASRRTARCRIVHLPGAELGGHLRATLGAVGCEMYVSQYLPWTKFSPSPVFVPSSLSCPTRSSQNYFSWPGSSHHRPAF